MGETLTDDLPTPSPSQILGILAGFATVVAINLTVVVIVVTSLEPLRDLPPVVKKGSVWAFLSLVIAPVGYLAVAIGFSQLVWVVPVATWRFAVKDSAFAKGMIIGAAMTFLLNLGGLMLWGLVLVLSDRLPP